MKLIARSTYHIAEIRSLDFRDRALHQLFPELPISVETETESRASPTGTTTSLVRICLAYRSDQQSVHPDLGVVDFQLTKPGINHILENNGGITNL